MLIPSQRITESHRNEKLENAFIQDATEKLSKTFTIDRKTG